VKTSHCLCFNELKFYFHTNKLPSDILNEYEGNLFVLQGVRKS